MAQRRQEILASVRSTRKKHHRQKRERIFCSVAQRLLITFPSYLHYSAVGTQLGFSASDTFHWQFGHLTDSCSSVMMCRCSPFLAWSAEAEAAFAMRLPPRLVRRGRRRRCCWRCSPRPPRSRSGRTAEGTTTCTTEKVMDFPLYLRRLFFTSEDKKRC